MNYGLLPRPLAADIEPEGILLTFPTPGGLELHLWVTPQRRPAFVTDAAGEVVLPVRGDPLRHLAVAPAAP